MKIWYPKNKMLVLWLILCLAIGIGFYRQEDTISKLSAANERRCQSIRLNQNVALFATEPADLTGLTPERLPIVQGLNARRAVFRKQLKAANKKLGCEK